MKTALKWDVRWILGGALALAVLALLALVLLPSLRGPEQRPAPDYWPTQGWRSSTPEEHGFDSAKMAEGLLAIRDNNINIHSLMVIRHGSVILDAYFYPYDGTIYHDLASVTKSLMTTLIGIAADQGKLDLDQPVLSFFPDRTIANRDARKERITVRHLVSMSSGLDCTEEDGERTQQEMQASPDYVQFVLDRPVAWEPGTHFVYCSPGMHLLSAVLQEATGMTALDFARANLFEPLGITDVYWPADPQGYTHGWGDVCLRPRDVAKLGFLWLHQGQWEDRQIVSRDWVAEASERRMTGTGRSEDYGYGWWVSAPDEEVPFTLAAGNGGQRIKVHPGLDLVLVTTGGGFEMDEIDPYLIAAIGDMEKPLPANPDGVARLESVVAELGQPPAPEAVPPLPQTAQAISGRTFVFEPNSLQLRSLRLDFDDSAEAIFQLEVANEPGPRVIGVGLDGVYRSSHAGRPIIARGYWADGSTFVVDYNEGPGLAAYTMRMRFDGNRMLFEIPGLGSFESRPEQP